MPTFYKMPSGRMRMSRNGSKRRGFKQFARGTAWVMRKKAQVRRRRSLNPRTGGYMGIELKFYDQKLINGTLTGTNDATGGEHDPSATLLLNTVTQGDGEQQRDGRKMTMRSIFIEGQVNCGSQTSQSAADAATVIYIALVLDTQTNGATLNSEDVFTNIGANAETSAFPARNLQNVTRYKVLATRKFVMDNVAITNDTGSTGGVIQSGLVKRFKIYKKLYRQVLFKGTTETVANIVDNSLHIIAWCTNTNLVPKLSYISRLRFVG